jgi:hypothetical protein
MPINTHDQLVAARRPLIQISKILTNLVAGRRQSLWNQAGIQGAGSYPATNTALPYGAASVGAVAPSTTLGGGNTWYLAMSQLAVHNLNVAAIGSVSIYDRLVTLSPSTTGIIVGATLPALALPRFATGRDVELFLESSGPNTTASNVSCTYTNSAGAGRTTQILALPVTASNGQFFNIPLQAGEQGLGIQSVQTFSNTVGTGAGWSFVLAKHIATISVPFTGFVDAQDYTELGLPDLTGNPALFFVVNPTVSVTANNGFLTGVLQLAEATP